MYIRLVDNLVVPSGRISRSPLLLRRQMQSWVIIAAFVVCCCGSTRQDSAAVPPSQIEVRLVQDVQLFDRTRTVSVRGDGMVTVEYHVKHNGKVADAASRTIDPMAVETLVNEILDAGFRQMPTEYRQPRTSVSRSSDGRYTELVILTADGTCTELALMVGSWRKVVRECNAAPRPLRNLYERVLTTAGEQQFQ